MAHFAQISRNGIVSRVLVVPDDQEHRAQDFLANDLGLGGTWIQTSYNGSIRRRFASVGMTHDPDLDVFLHPRPYASWTLNADHDWQAPIPYPSDGLEYEWSEPDLDWLLIG